jgi:hypothetical protein
MDSIPGLELFNSYEQDFNDLVISIRNALNVDAKNSVGGTLPSSPSLHLRMNFSQQKKTRLNQY